MTALIRLEDVSKKYHLGLTRTSLPMLVTHWAKRTLDSSARRTATNNLLWALKNVTFELKRGESLALIGPNGAGKSTILKLLSKITLPTSGHIEVNGHLSALIELGAGFHPDLTGRENIFLNGTILGLKRHEINKRLDQIIAFSELERFLDTPIKRYSSGMVVRLGFAVASCIEPDILLVDEVLAVGDVAFQQKCVERIKTLLNNGTSLIFVSHNSELVRTVCNTGIYLDKGEVQVHGEVGEVIDAYTHAIEKQRMSQLISTQSAGSVPEAEIEITKIEVIGSNENSVKELLTNRPAQIDIFYSAYRDLGRVHLVVRIYRADGVPCCLMRTSHDGVNLEVFQGEGVISVTLDPIQLHGGTYHVVAWLMDADDIIGLARGSSAWFEVKNPVAGLDPYDAVYAPFREWRLRGLSSPVSGEDRLTETWVDR